MGVYSCSHKKEGGRGVGLEGEEEEGKEGGREAVEKEGVGFFMITYPLHACAAGSDTVTKIGCWGVGTLM